MKYWLISLLGFIVMWVLVTLFVWWVTYDEFGLSFGQSSSIVLGAYMILLFKEYVGEWNNGVKQAEKEAKAKAEIEAAAKRRKELWNSGEV